jgi:hypothetical protein
MTTRYCIVCLIMLAGSATIQAEDSTNATAQVILQTNAVRITAGESLLLRCRVLNSQGKQEPLVYAPRTRSGREGYDLALEFRFKWDNARELVLAEQRLVYRNAHTFAYELSSTMYNQRTSCLVVINADEAVLYGDEHQLTRVAGQYSVLVRYRHRHQGLLDCDDGHQVWSDPAIMRVTVEKTSAIGMGTPLSGRPPHTTNRTDRVISGSAVIDRRSPAGAHLPSE